MRLIDADELMKCIPREEYCSRIAVANAPTVEPQRWIPCSERLPEEIPYYYLVTVANHGTFFTTTFPDEVAVVKWDYDRRKGRSSFHWCDERTVTAWMPLPEPYREDSE